MLRKRRWLSTGVLLLALTQVSASRAAEPLAYDELMSAAARAAEAGDWAGAARALDAESSRFAEDFPFQLARGYYLLRSARFDDSASAYRSALALNPESQEARLGFADALAGAKRWGEAEPILSGLVERRPDDAALLDRHALALFSLGRLDDAEVRYRRALEANASDAQALSGLGWIALRREEVNLSRRHFERALGIDPKLASAREGLAALPRENRFRAQVHLGGESSGVSANGSGKISGLELVAAAGLDAVLGDHWLAGGFYRHFGSLSGRGTATPLLTGQDEGYLLAGYARRTWGVAGHLAYISPVSNAGGNRRRAASSGLGGPMLGASVRVDQGARWVGSTSYTIYDDLSVFQGHLSVTRDFTRWLSLTGGGRMQAGGGEWHPSVLLAAALSGGGWRLVVGSDFGDQLRPVELDGPAVYNVTGLRAFTGFTTLAMPFGERFSGVLSYRYELYRNDAGAQDDTGLQRVTFGLNFAL